MKKSIKRIIILVLLICGIFYIFENKMFEGESVKKVRATMTNTNLLLVNRKYGLDENYKPEKLTIPNIKFNSESDDEEKHVSKTIVKSLEKMFNDALSEGIVLIGNSGYRSYESQVETYNNRVRSEGRKMADAYVAKPGFSEHQTGLCIDITNESKYFVKGTKEADWLNDNCYKYGFIIRYPEGKEDITGISYEPWHVRYVGIDVAKEIHNKNITLEEYLKKNKLI